jgi:hypothetical protein
MLGRFGRCRSWGENCRLREQANIDLASMLDIVHAIEGFIEGYKYIYSLDQRLRRSTA